MNGLTNYITEQPWTDTITQWYVLVDDAYQRLIARRGRPLRRRGPAPRFSDSEVITVSLIIETFFQGHEEVGYAFVSQYLRDLFPDLIDLDRFNARRRELIAVIETIRRDLRDQILDGTDAVRLVDSAPVTLMTYTRGARCRSVAGSQYFGVVTSKKSKIFGLRLHIIATAEQLVDEWVLAPAAAHDLKVLDALVQDCRDLVTIGDKAYNARSLDDQIKLVRIGMSGSDVRQLLGEPVKREKMVWIYKDVTMEEAGMPVTLYRVYFEHGKVGKVD